MGELNGLTMQTDLKSVLAEDQVKLLKYWVSRCTPTSLPKRSDISPADLVFCLGHSSIIERRLSGEFVFRLTASSLRDILGAECRGKLVDDECNEDDAWITALSEAIYTRSPVFGLSPLGHRRVHHWMRLPLATMDSGRQPVLCYDRIHFEKEGELPRAATMFVSARNEFSQRELQPS